MKGVFSFCRRPLVWIGLAAIYALPLFTLPGAVDMFLKIEGVAGESKDDAHKDEIDVLSWSWGASQSGTFQDGSGGAAGKVSVQDLAFTKYIDKSSPDLMLYLFTGQQAPYSELYVRKAGTNPYEYITIKFEPVIITSYSTGGAGGEDSLTEHVTLNYGKVTFEYVEQDATGGPGTTHTVEYDTTGTK